MLPPIMALLVVGTCLGLQHRAISTAQADCVTLRKQLAAATASTAASPAGRAGSSNHTKAAAPISWRTFANQLDESQRAGATADMRLMLRMQRRLQAMTREELIAGLDAIPALGLTGNARSMFEQELIGPLIEKDPQYVLTRFIDAVQDEASGLKWHLPGALRDWAKQDPGTADAWLDQQIAAGKFASKALDCSSPFRIQFEEALAGVLLAADPAALGRRMSALAPDQRASLINRELINTVTEPTQAAFTKLVREQVSAADQAYIFTRQAAALATTDGFSKVDEFLTRIAATPADRAACVAQAATSNILRGAAPPTRERLDAVRAWGSTQAPDTVDAITGDVLATAAQLRADFSFDDAAGLALQFSQSGGSDEVLAAFLDTWYARNHQEQARAWAGQIADETRREAILKGLN